MAVFYRVGSAGLHDEKLFCCATKAAAERWKTILRRDIGVVEIHVNDNIACAINTHGYCEADWRIEGVEDKKQIFRVSGSAKEISGLAQICADEEEYCLHEVVFESRALCNNMSFF